MEEVRELPQILTASGFNNENVTVVSLRIPVWESVIRLTDEQARRERGNRADDSEDGIFGRLASYYKGLGLRTSQARRNNWRVEQVKTFGKDRNIATVQKKLEKDLDLLHRAPLVC